MPNTFHSSQEYRKLQSQISKRNWKIGLYDFKKASLVIRNCKYLDCNNTFEVKTFDQKLFCSKSCAAKFNNKGRKLSRETKLKIANSLSLNTVVKLKSEIYKPKRYIHPLNVSESELRKLYCDDQLSSGEIAEKMGVGVFRIIKKLKKYGIARRTSAESNK